MRRLTPFAAFVLGIAFAIAVAGVTSLFIWSGWIILPIVLGSALGTTVLMIRQWNQRPRQKPADSEQRRRSWAEIALQNAMNYPLVGRVRGRDNRDRRYGQATVRLPRHTEFRFLAHDNGVKRDAHLRSDSGLYRHMRALHN
jgi:hypothetical protein